MPMVSAKWGWRRVNVVLVLIDSLNRSSLSAYAPSGTDTPATPNLDAFARRAWRFDTHFAGSLPCMPARREIFTGFQELLFRPWGPLEPFDARLPRLLEEQGYTTGLVTDHYHYWEPLGNGYMQSFQSAQLVRGHEADFWQPPVKSDEPLPPWVQRIEEWRPGAGRRYWANVKEFQREEDFFPAKVFSGASRWLERHGQKGPFFLQVESFDSHEPFHVPEPYASMYWDGPGKDDYTVWPPYQSAERQAAFFAETTPQALAFIRSQYAGKVTMVDRWFGELMSTLDRLALWDETAVIVTTDHGHDLGEREVFAKSYPHWDSHAHLPLFLWHPDLPGNGQGVGALTATVDLFATTLDLCGVEPPTSSESRSLLPLLSGEAVGREAAIYGMFGQGVCCTDGDWTLFKSPVQDGPLYSYSTLLFPFMRDPERTLRQPVGTGQFIPGVDLPQWKLPVKSEPRSWENFLFNRRDDPGQTCNLWDEDVEQRTRVLEVLRGVMARQGAPAEQYERLGLSA